MKRRLFLSVMAAAMAMSVAACEEEASSEVCAGKGVERCMGEFITQDRVTDPATSVVTLSWDTEADGPKCVHGTQFRAFVRPATGNSNNLLIYLPNDGVWLPEHAYALLQQGHAPTSLSAAQQTSHMQSPHPAMGDTTMLYVPACDGSLYVGSRDYTEEELEDPKYKRKDARFYRGFYNAVGSINSVADMIQTPDTIYIVGSGAGSYGVLLSAMHTATLYPSSDIYVIQDGSPGFGFGRFDVNFAKSLVDQWGVQNTLPPCSYCLENGHLTGFVDYMLETYSNIRFATYISTGESSVRTFLNLTDPTEENRITADKFRCFIQQELGGLHERHPERYFYYVADAAANTIDALSRPDDDTQSGLNYVAVSAEDGTEIRLRDWLSYFVDNDSRMRSIAEISMVPSTDPSICR